MKGLSAIQIEQLRQIGDYLRQVRETQSVSLEKVAKDTFIPLRLLNALEVGEVERLPEPIYIKGFIRRYADVLELDGAEIADAFDTNAPVANPVPVPAPAAPAIAPPSHLMPERRTADANRPSGIPGWAYGVAGIAVLGGVGVLAWGLNQAFQPRPATVTPPHQTVTSSAATAVSPNPAANNAPTSPASPAPNANRATAPTSLATPDATRSAANAPVQVEINLVDQSWMEVVTDGKVAFEGTLNKGTQRTWTAQNTLLIRAGNAGAVVASYNQGQAKPLGRLGDVVDANFTRETDPAGTPAPPQ